MHFDAAAFAADQTGLAERLEMLGERGFGDGFLGDVQEVRAIARTVRARDVSEDRHAHGIGERVEDAFDRDVFD